MSYNPPHQDFGNSHRHDSPFGRVTLGRISVLPALIAMILMGCHYEPGRNADRTSGEVRSYSTKFSNTEPMLSEGGIWINGSVAGDSLWGNIQTMAGLAFGVSEPTKYGDPTAILKGEWGPDQEAQVTVRVIDYARFKDISCHEVEVRLRTTINGAAGMITGYEVYGSLMANNPYLHIASWGGPNGDKEWSAFGISAFSATDR